MTGIDDTPSRELLQGFLLGTLVDEERRRVEDYLESSTSAADTLLGLMPPADTLVTAISTVSRVPAVDPEVRELVKAAKQLSVTDLDRTLGEVHANPALPADWSQLLAPAEQADELGRLGGYRVLRILGQGGMGVVFEAEDPRLHRRVALKVVKPSITQSAAAKERFLREARAAAAVEHDNIIAIHQVGEDRGVPYLAMPLLQGESLEYRLQRERRLPLADVIRIGREIALGLAAAHDCGLIHRDIKPANIWLDGRSGRVKILDFGLARAVEDAHEPTLTHSGSIVGTPSYMAPEQAEARPIQARTDLFSLGCVLFRATTGEMPFPGSTPLQVLSALANHTPPRVNTLTSDVPTELSDLIAKLLSKSPANRPTSAQDLARQLKAIHERMMATEVLPLVAPTATASGGHRWLTTALFGLIALSAGLGWVFGGALILIATNNGELNITIDDPNVEVIVRQNDVEVHQKSTQRRFRVRPVNGEVEFIDPDTGAVALTKKFELKRAGERASITITAEQVATAGKSSSKPALPADVAPAKPTVPGVRLADKPKPFAVLRDGKLIAEYAFCPANLPDYRDGDVIEIRGNGPFPVPQIELNHSLHLRAADGYQPVLIAPDTIRDHQAWIAITRGKLVVEGCELRLLNISNSALLQPRGDSCDIINCTLVRGTASVGTVASLLCPKARIIGSHLISEYSHLSLHVGPELKDLEFRNNLYWNRAGVFLAVDPGAGHRTLRLERNTFCGRGLVVAGMLFHENSLKNPPPGQLPVAVIAHDNVFAADETTLMTVPSEGLAPLAAYPSLVSWHGRNNVGRKFLDQATVEQLAGPDHAGLVTDPALQVAHERGWAAQTPLAERLSLMQAALEPGLPKAGDRIGPKWELIGPGAGYQRTLAEPENADPSPPEPLEGGSFTLLHPGEPDRGFIQLDNAVLAAVDGDIIELRTNGPVAARLQPETPGRRITLRAARGYQPESVDVSELKPGPGHSWQVVNLMLRGAMWNHFDECIHTLTNCAWIDDEPSMGDISFFASSRREGGPNIEVLNCVIPGRLRCDVASGRKLVVRNSVVKGVLIGTHRSQPDDVPELQFEDCVCWQPGDENWGFLQLERHELQAATAVNRCVIEAGYLTPSLNRLKWTGDGNQYRLWYHDWLPKERGGEGVQSLADLQKFWNSDAHSTEYPSLQFDPQQWRITSSGRDAIAVGVDFTKFKRPFARILAPGQ